MNKRLYYILGISGLLFVVACAFGYFIHKSDKLKSYATQIEAHLQEEEEKVTSFFNNKDFIYRQLIEEDSTPFPQIEDDFKYLEKYSAESFSISIFLKDSLVYWTNNFAIPHSEEIHKASPQLAHKLIQLRNGSYEMMSQKFMDSKIGEYTIFGLIPIKYTYELDSKYLEHKFSANPNIPAEVKIQKAATNFPIKHSDGQVLAYLSSGGKTLTNLAHMQWLLFLFLGSYLFFAIFLNSYAHKVVKERSQLRGAAILITGLFGVRILMMLFNFGDYFSMLPIFSQNFDTSISSSLGDLLINIVLLLWIMLFFYREFKIPSYNHLSPNGKFWYTALNYFSILIGILLITGVFKTLVFNTTISFDFDNVFNLDRYSLIAIIGVILLLMALYLFSHRIMSTIVGIGLNWFTRLGALGLALVASIPLLFLFDLLLPTIYILLIAFVFIQIFDLFIDSKVVTFTWLVIWLVILSAFPAILLFKYNAYRDRTVRLSYAKQLSNLRDQVAENAFIELKNKIKDDDFIKSEFAKPFPFRVDAEKIKRQIDKYFTHNNYLFYNYDYEINAFNKYAQPTISDQEGMLNDIVGKLDNAQSIIDEDLKFWSNEDGKHNYIIQLDIPIRENTDNPVSLYLEFIRQRREPSKVYTELLIDKQYKNLIELGKYEYAIYKNNKRIDSEGKIYGPLLTINNIPAPGKSTELIQNNRSDLIYHGEDGVIVLLGREKETFLKAISLFSYIFGMLISLVLSFALLNTIFPILPNTVSFSISSKPSLKNRIQLSVISLIVVSFVIIGFVTVWFFQTSSEEYHESRLERKTSSVLTDAQHEIEILSAIDSILDLQKMVVPISQIHRIDVNLYDLRGRLLNSSEGDIFNKGILSPWMPALAHQALAKQRRSEFIQEQEKVGDLIYKASYVPLKNMNNNTIAYLGLPYYSKQRKLRSDITVFMSTLLNVYVFLLLIAGGIAIMVANSITKPLAKIGEKLKQLRLGGSNEPLEWKSKDELGALIGEYNKMITQLDDSADRLAQSERESAWREMAKQVAHEIKNPLTPMKLSIQYLEHAYRSNPENIEPLLKRVSGTLIEQIDNLAHIASEFSNFAKMPRAENQQLQLNQLISSVFLLFSNEREDMEMTLDVPEEKYFVFADKNHLMRVFNNLIKNAIQAIPDDRDGMINVSLFLDGNTAIVKVKDNGSGIPDDKADKVFVPNFTTKSSGTGLGLAISKNIIESVDGRIHFITEVGKGTDFYVELPLVDVKELEEV